LGVYVAPVTSTPKILRAGRIPGREKYGRRTFIMKAKFLQVRILAAFLKKMSQILQPKKRGLHTNPQKILKKGITNAAAILKKGLLILQHFPFTI
jgi:hypothetical protein